MREEQLEDVAKLFKTLSEPVRLRILSCLMEGSKTVGEIVELTALKQGNVSKHLKILSDADLLSRQKEGNYVYYRIAQPLLFDLCGLVCQQLEETAQGKLDRLKA
ncbi:ArsR/SmtB family transcription factor [Rubritalea tangerina]|uniref:ArsR/SmtB family transcription factor n=2 Tax=Rubritalea tangerina TaxID=430798 RepID=A0ABW4Z7L3_9BACT